MITYKQENRKKKRRRFVIPFCHYFFKVSKLKIFAMSKKKYLQQEKEKIRSLRKHIAIRVTKLGNTQQFCADLGRALCITHVLPYTKLYLPLSSPPRKQAAVLLGDYPELSPPLADSLNKTLGGANSV